MNYICFSLSTSDIHSRQFSQQSDQNMIQIDHDHLSQDYSINVKTLNPSPSNLTGVFTAGYLMHSCGHCYQIRQASCSLGRSGNWSGIPVLVIILCMFLYLPHVYFTFPSDQHFHRLHNSRSSIQHLWRSWSRSFHLLYLAHTTLGQRTRDTRRRCVSSPGCFFFYYQHQGQQRWNGLDCVSSHFFTFCSCFY